jgi:NADH:ubiquinone reductase (H+-translocating)
MGFGLIFVRISVMADKKTTILIAGGGFGGVKAALELADDNNFDVTLLSNETDFRYYPALYHTATGGRPEASSIPLDEIFSGKSVTIMKATAKKLDRNAKTLKTARGDMLGYDKLVIALGAVTNYFGIKGLKEYSHGIKSQAEAQELRNHIHEMIVDEGKPDQNYVVIGGGPTGVELAGALPAYIRHIMKRHGLKDRRLHIDLVEAAPRLMPRMPREYSAAAAKRLRKLGVTLYLNHAVLVETADALKAGDHSFDSHTVVWTAGVAINPFFDNNRYEVGKHGKIQVDKYLQAEQDIYIIGDNADTPFSGMAQTALHDAKFVAENLKRQVSGRRPRTYKPKRPVYITPVGPEWAAVLWNRVHLYGWVGWLLRGAADFMGYRDYEPWWNAGTHWIAEYEDEPDCAVCAGKA